MHRERCITVNPCSRCMRRKDKLSYFGTCFKLVTQGLRKTEVEVKEQEVKLRVMVSVRDEFKDVLEGDFLFL